MDKDLAAVVLAECVEADALLLLTDVSAVHRRWGSPGSEPIRRLTLAEADAGVEDGTFAPGSMGPKVRAAAEFVRRTGGFAGIGVLGEAVAVLQGRAGTQVVDEARPALARRSCAASRCTGRSSASLAETGRR